MDGWLNEPLFRFQKTTLARLLQQEDITTPTPDPTFLPIHSLDSDGPHQQFYIQSATTEVSLEPPMYIRQVGGGVLAEEMGAGKTVIVLALALATRGTISKPDNNPESSVSLTHISLRNYPNEPYSELRKLFRIPQPDRLPSLFDMLLHTTAIGGTSLLDFNYKVSASFALSPLSQVVTALQPFYAHHKGSVKGPRISEMKNSRYPHIIYLSCATLIVVPTSLYEQWKGEIYKFCRDGVLKILFVGDKGVVLPHATELAKYDVSRHLLYARS